MAPAATTGAAAELEEGFGKGAALLKEAAERRGWCGEGRKVRQYFLNSTSSGGLISTVLLPTSFQLVLRTVPPDSICSGNTQVEIASAE